MRGLLWLLTALAACGRIGFDPSGGVPGGDAPDDTAPGDSTLPARTTVQSSGGEVLMTGTQLVVPVTAVDPAHAFLVFSYRGRFTTPVAGLIAGQLIDATTLQFDRVGGGTDAQISWFLVEAPYVSVQRGAFRRPAFEVSAAIDIAPVDATKSIVIASAAGGDSDFSGADHVRASFDGADDRIRLAVGSNELPELIAWQVITFENATVASGVGAIGVGALTQPVTVPSLVDPATFWLASWTVADTTAGIGHATMDMHRSNSITLACTRDVTGDALLFAWFAVTIPGARVITGEMDLVASTGGIQTPLNPAIALDRSFAFVAGNLHGGRSSLVGTPPGDDGGSVTVAAYLPNANAVEILRSTTPGELHTTWFVVELP